MRLFRPLGPSSYNMLYIVSALLTWLVNVSWFFRITLDSLIHWVFAFLLGICKV